MAVDIQTGTELWIHRSNRLMSPPVVDSDIGIIREYRILRAFNPDEGWRTPIVRDRDHIYVATKKPCIRFLEVG